MLSSRYVLACALLIISSSSNAALLFSEYVEGSSFNKALELFNTGTSIDFSTGNYVIDIYTNGAVTPRFSISLSGVLAEHDTFVVANSSADIAITSVSDMLTGSLSFNGDDAITLSYNDLVIDRIGQIGIDPGSEWGAGLTSTQDNTLRRLGSILSGEDDPYSMFEPSKQWQGFTTDDFTDLGIHSVEGISMTNPAGGSVSVPLPGSSALIVAGLLPLLIMGFNNSYRRTGMRI